MNLNNRILGCLGGLALGDALGCPTEFLTRAQIKAEFGWVDRFVRAPAWHPHHAFQPGQVTDDTGQTLAVAYALDASGELTAEEVARQLIKWANDLGEAAELVMGPSTRAALERIRRGESPRQTGAKGSTNGAAYRGIIPGLVDQAQPERILPQVVEACLPTHGTGTAIAGALAVAYAVAAALGVSPSLESILVAAQSGARAGAALGTWDWSVPLEKRIELAVRLVQENPEPEAALAALSDYVGTGMQVAESVASAFGVIALAKGDPMKAVQFGANIGGDTDTIAALAGSVCGAWKGVEALDAGLLDQVERVNQLDLSIEADHLAEIFEKRKTE